MNPPPFTLAIDQVHTIPEPVELWHEGEPPWISPDSRVEASVEERGDGFLDRFLTNVTVPTLTPYLPDRGSRPRIAVLICPGGAYRGVAIDKEGHDIARWLNDRGIAAFVLQYRGPSPERAPHCRPSGPLRDAQRALRLIRTRAHDWRVDPRCLGIMGFSAGGHVAASASTLFTDTHETDPQLAGVSCRPDFTILVYPVISFTEPGTTHSGSRANLLGPVPSEALMTHFSCELQVTAKTPPAFMVQTGDDTVPVNNSICYYQALQAAGVPAELHVYAQGGHGYGMRVRDLPIGSWTERCAEWLAAMAGTRAAAEKAG